MHLWQLKLAMWTVCWSITDPWAESAVESMKAARRKRAALKEDLKYELHLFVEALKLRLLLRSEIEQFGSISPRRPFWGFAKDSCHVEIEVSHIAVGTL